MAATEAHGTGVRFKGKWGLVLGNYLTYGSAIKFNFRQIPNRFARLPSFWFGEASFTYFTSSPLSTLFCERVVTRKEEH